VVDSLKAAEGLINLEGDKLDNREVSFSVDDI